MNKFNIFIKLFFLCSLFKQFLAQNDAVLDPPNNPKFFVKKDEPLQQHPPVVKNSDRPDNSYFVKKSQNNDPALLANSKEINVPQQPPKRFVQKIPNKKNSLMISQTSECEADIQRVCPSNQYNLANNFDVLSCLSVEVESEDLSQDCNHFIWEYKLNMTKNTKFHSLILNVCQRDFKKMTECDSGQLNAAMISCMTENKQKIEDPQCLDLLHKVDIIMFNDFHFIGEFISDCERDVVRHHCGKLHIAPTSLQQNGVFHSQEKVLHCLQDHLDEDGGLQPECVIQIIRLAEFSADDYHMDKYLYIRCKNDRETFCADVAAGGGRVYKCLFDHKLDPKMTQKCAEALTGREQLVAVDYKASSTLVQHCHNDIVQNGCDHTLSTVADKSHAEQTKIVHLSNILLCLETSSRKGVPVSDKCQQELIGFRQMLMNDYQLVPEITKHCEKEINDKCDRGLAKNGETLHCLFNLATQAGGVNKECNKALFGVIKETNVAGDYRMDAVLTHACQSVIDVKCMNYKAGDPMVVGCLIEHLNDPDMKKSCRKAVTEIQYFISRDFRIDPNFRNACDQESRRLCHVPVPQLPLPGDGPKHPPDAAMPLSLVISCLYRHIHPESGFLPVHPLSQECEDEVLLVLKQRALDVRLNPELEEKCRVDLARLCSKTPHQGGTEFVCLQDNYDNLSPDCRSQVKSLTQIEGQNVMDFENILVKECEPMLKQFCGDLLHDPDEGKVMDCLIDNKENMESEKCQAGITHFQLIEMKDYHLDLKFLTACTDDIRKHCANVVADRAQVVKCLSEIIRNHKLSDGKTASLSKNCSAEVKVDRLQMHRSIELNPDLNKSCQSDVDRLCLHVKTGEAQVIECLREYQANVTKECRRHLFQFKKEESKDRSLDYQLLKKCRKDIRKHCFDDNDEDDDDDDDGDDDDYIFECLVENKHILEKACKAVVTEREKEIFSDVSLNSELQSSCLADIDHYCEQEKMEAVEDHKEGKNPHGIIYECLKETYANRNKKLSTSCHEHIEKVIREQQQDYALDPQLTLKCLKSIERLCPPKEGFSVVECLKKEYFKGRLSNDNKCMLEVAKILNEGLSDIMADPFLQQACVTDLERHCSSIPEGNGRLISCLVSAADEGKSLTAQCYEQVQVRKDMWKKSFKKVDGLADLHNIVMDSQHSNYIFSVLICIIVIVLALGVICGRLTKRAARYRRMI